MSSFFNPIKSLIQPVQQKFEESNTSSGRLGLLNLTDKQPYDKSQRSERADFANFLIESQYFYKTNRFLCVVFPPSNIPALTEYYKKGDKGFRFSCESAALPSQTIETFDYKMGNNNPVVKMPYTINYGGEITLTFRMSKDFLERKFLLTWQENIFTFGGGKPGARYMNEYAFNSSIILSQIDTANNKIYNTEFINAYPLVVSGIDYNWSPSDDYVKQTVTFAYSKMMSEGVKRGEDYPRGVKTK